MDKVEIISAIQKAIQAGVTSVEEREDPQKGHTYGAHIRSLCTVNAPNQEAVHSVMQVLQRQSELDLMMKSFYIPGPGGGGVGVLPIKVANWLLAKSLRLAGGAPEAVQQLEDFALKNEVEGLRVVAVYGVHVKGPVVIDEATKLLPLSMLQPSIGLDHLEEVLGEVVYHLPMIRTEEVSPEPAIGAVVQRFKMKPALQLPGASDPEWEEDHRRAFARLTDIAYATTLVEGAMPQVVSQWVETNGIDVIPGLTGGVAGDFEMMEVIPQKFEWRRSLSVEKLNERLSAFVALEPAVKRRLAPAFRRLALFEARRNLSDKAIELGIALESLLGDKDANGEISHKVATRGAIFSSKEGLNKP